MTQEHPITPPPELVSKWCYEDGEEIKSSPRWFFSVCAKAAQWGADQELEACLGKVSFFNSQALADRIRAVRRPKPPSLKEQALKALDDISIASFEQDAANVIRRALEQLTD
jgi:hypothetical protein